MQFDKIVLLWVDLRTLDQNHQCFYRKYHWPENLLEQFPPYFCISESISELSSTGSHGVLNWSKTLSIVKGPPAERIS